MPMNTNKIFKLLKNIFGKDVASIIYHKSKLCKLCSNIDDLDIDKCIGCQNYFCINHRNQNHKIKKGCICISCLEIYCIGRANEIQCYKHLG